MKKQTSAAAETQSKGRQLIDFSGKTIYVGIDTHKKDWQVAKVYDGFCLGNHRMAANSTVLIKHLADRYPGAHFDCVYESGAWGFKLKRELNAAGMDCIIVHAADVSSSDKEKKRKTDNVDALKLARKHSKHELSGIYVPEEALQKQRSLVRYRIQLTGDITRSKNRLKSLLKYQGIDIPQQFDKPGNWSHNFMNWIVQQANKDALLKDSLLLMLEQIRLLRNLLLKTQRLLREMMKTSKYQREYQLLLSTSGIGFVAATQWLLEIGDVRRFGNFDRLNSFIGFCPDTDSSGDTHRDTGITSRGHKRLRSVLIEASWQALRTDAALMESYRQLLKRMDGKHAIIRIAHKLVRRIRTVLLTEIPYQKGIVA